MPAISDVALGRVIALAAFLWTYVGLTLGRVPGFRVDRTGIAVIGAAAMVVTGVIPWDAAVAAVDTHTLVLLFGMMIVSAYLRLSGFFHLVTLWAERLALHRPVVLTVISAALSNLVSNVPAVLLFKTIVPTFPDPARAWLLLAMASTLAGNLTILGSVANLIVVETARGARVEIGFFEYAKVGVPLTVATLALGWLLLGFVV